MLYARRRRGAKKAIVVYENTYRPSNPLAAGKRKIGLRTRHRQCSKEEMVCRNKPVGSKGTREIAKIARLSGEWGKMVIQGE